MASWRIFEDWGVSLEVRILRDVYLLFCFVLGVGGRGGFWSEMEKREEN